MLSSDLKERYYRHIILPEIGAEGQEKILNAKVLIIGLGGLGSPVALYLAASGVGALGLMDHDKIKVSNLQRQILYQEEDTGKVKAVVAGNRINSLNTGIDLEIFDYQISKDNAGEIISRYDVVVGAVDNSEARYIIDEVTAQQQKPFIHGAVMGFEGQVAVFNYKGGPAYRQLFPDPPQKDFAGEQEKGVFAPVTGIIGSVQSSETLKVIIGCGDVLSGKMLIFSGLNSSFQIISY